MEDEKNSVGRPLIFKTPEELQAKINEYFVNEPKWTLAGLALSLGIDRKTLYNYKDRDEFFHIVKKAVETVESRYEERLIYDNSPTGVIFALKNMGWTDKSEMDVTSKGEQINGFNYIPPSNDTNPVQPG